MKIGQTLILLLLIVTMYNCRSEKFLKFSSIIEIVVPEDCTNCAFGVLGDLVLNHNDIEFSDISGGDFESFNENGSAIHVVYDPNNPVLSVEIFWDEYYESEDDYDIDPNGQRRFLLVNEYYHSFPGPDTKIVGQHVKKLKPRKVYRWNPEEGTFKKTGEETEDPNGDGSSSGSGNELSGKWNQINACSNNSGQRNYFNFSSSTSGEIGQIDCNDQCLGGGVFTSFDYSISGSNVSITPKAVTDYCGVESTLASSFTVPFSISGNVLTLDGERFEK